MLTTVYYALMAVLRLSWTLQASVLFHLDSRDPLCNILRVCASNSCESLSKCRCTARSKYRRGVGRGLFEHLQPSPFAPIAFPPLRLSLLSCWQGFGIADLACNASKISSSSSSASCTRDPFRLCRWYGLDYSGYRLWERPSSCSARRGNQGEISVGRTDISSDSRAAKRSEG